MQKDLDEIGFEAVSSDCHHLTKSKCWQIVVVPEDSRNKEPSQLDVRDTGCTSL